MPSFSDPVTEIHEERLQRLETGMQNVVTSTALTSQKLDQLSDKISEGFITVNKALEKGAQQFDLHDAALSEQQAEIEKLKGVEAARIDRWSSIKKAALPLLAAAAGVIATKGGETFWNWLTVFFHH
jgi:hypothetical protein